MHKESAKKEAYSTSRQDRAKVKHLTAQQQEPDAFAACLHFALTTAAKFSQQWSGWTVWCA